ncbi:MAG: 5'-nucleotidase, lipoprotein e(P4) family [Candidatus Cloacimonadota bacterium]|nr:5'-nucleotidase, lipoprotein e(P4) family [Candidatus Cloacimonadota bacterium]
MKTRILIPALLLIFLLTSLSANAENPQMNDESFLMAALWQTTSAEYRALCYQAYNIARVNLEKDMQIKTEKKRAILVDMDETIIDNSLYNAVRVVREQEYPKEFYKWIDSSKADAVAGAMDFLNFADRNNYEIFYITNRRMESYDISLKQLQTMNFPQADSLHLLLKETSSNKETRRQMIAGKYHIALLLGDNCDDFSEEFYRKSIEERKNAVNFLKDEFGTKFIILPNPIHGAWKKAIYEYKNGLSTKEKTKMKLEKLKIY